MIVDVSTEKKDYDIFMILEYIQNIFLKSNVL